MAENSSDNLHREDDMDTGVRHPDDDELAVLPSTLLAGTRGGEATYTGPVSDTSAVTEVVIAKTPRTSIDALSCFN